MNQLLSSRVTFLLTGLVLVTCWNGTMVDSGSGKKDKRPDVNFYGQLTDHTCTMNVEDILIGGRYEQIPVFQTGDYSPEQNSKNQQNQPAVIDPKQNKIMMDLSEISSISLKNPDRPIEAELNINNRKYSEVEITSINGTKKTYLIESSRELTCLKVDKGPDNDQKPIYEERKLNIIHVKNLLIQGYKTGAGKVSTPAKDVSVSDKGDVAQNTEQILDQIEKKVNNLPKEDPSNYEKLKSSLLSLLRSLRDQLQKLLGMIKN